MKRRTAHSQAGWALLVSGVASARVEAHRLHQHLLKVLQLVESSEEKEHLYQVAGDLIQSVPDNLARLEASLDMTTYALARMGEEHLKDRLTISQRALVDESVEGAQPFDAIRKRNAFRAPAQEWMGPTGVGGNPKDRSGILPTERSENKDSLERMSPLPDHGSREVAIPEPANHAFSHKDRPNQIGKFEYVKPEKTPIKTRRLPDDQSEMPHPFKEDFGYPRRRVMDAAGPFPDYDDKQREQKGPAKEYDKRKYQRAREQKKLDARRRYQLKDKFDPDFKRDRKMREMYPHKFDRKPQGGVQTLAERAERTRDRSKGAISRVASDFLAREAGSYDSITFFRSVDERKPSTLGPDHANMEERNHVETRAHGDPAAYTFGDPHSPGSAKVIPESSDASPRKDREQKWPPHAYKEPYP